MKAIIKTCVCLAAVLTALSADAQRLTLDHVQLSGNQVVVYYHLEDENSNHRYLVNLFTSKDNFSTPLTRVTGDVGTDVAPGRNKKIIWDITNELGAFKGELVLEVRGRVFVPFVKLQDFGENKVFKRGKNYPLTWKSGNLRGQLNIELYRDEERIMGENNLPNTGKYDWYIPTSVRKGSGYRLKFTNSKDRNEILYSPPFRIRRKTPLVLKAVGVAAVGAAIVVFGTGKDNAVAGGAQDEPEEPLPENPGLPE